VHHIIHNKRRGLGGGGLGGREFGTFHIKHMPHTIAARSSTLVSRAIVWTANLSLQLSADGYSLME
jgi:hypothetical protein